ncbi:cobalt/nickel transport protein [Desulfofundulus australicus DSM 11792]|uniref:Cobalt/nickel transport protein n=1 Tax=Desulfofundulus australicus DSM 11792 TaxID=1121425 RepID=A0A1M5AY85_9FIRM|nr:PDGLE domain-containing protein [Desulfofundulus australicus]SHF35198.1 cobalt/nickel transport protein [Desulfofundulus australicus DSM 11792]
MNKKNLLWGLLVALAVAAFLSPFASPSPDGLERVAEDKGFLHLAEGKELIHALMPDYVFPGVASGGLATSLAGLVGTLLVFAAMYLLVRLVIRPKGSAGKGPSGKGHLN